MTEDDVINFEIVYESPWGYWTEMTAVMSFRPLEEEADRLLRTYLEAVDNSSALAKPGMKLRAISDANDQTFIDCGYTIAGKHTPDCHPIGLDGSDGPSSLADPDFTLEANQVLSFHPGTVLPENRGFLISDNFLVTPTGGVRLSPHSFERHMFRLDPRKKRAGDHASD